MTEAGNSIGRKTGCALELGRIAITFPRYGRLDVYVKQDGRRGAMFISLDDGGRFGATRGLMARFGETGTLPGWGYVNEQYGVVFRFVRGRGSNAPENLIAIETVEGRVDLPRSVRRGADYADGALVAFYARLTGPKGPNLPRRQATDVFPVDAGHIGIAARLIGAGRLDFPQHNEVAELFLDSVSGAGSSDRQNRQLFDSALAYLASDVRVPSNLQALARVERSRLSVADGAEIAPASALKRSPVTRGKRTSRTSKAGVADSAKTGIAADVVRLNLDI